MHKKIGIVIQARVGSTRLPAKVLMPIEGRPMLAWLLARLKMASNNYTLICAIPDDAENNVLEALCKKQNVHVVRGPEQDVLARYVMAADRFNLSDVIRITGDCPLMDFRLIDSFREIHCNGNWDFTANSVGTDTAFPRGMDVEIIKASALRLIGDVAHKKKFREHVTLYVYENPTNLKVNLIAPQGRQCRPELRLCVDEPADLNVVRKIYRHFLASIDFSLDDIIAFLDQNPAITKINADVRQKAY
jgi:spore coat polysaccharide biosynthesis protein SpsF